MPILRDPSLGDRLAGVDGVAGDRDDTTEWLAEQQDKCSDQPVSHDQVVVDEQLPQKCDALIVADSRAAPYRSGWDGDVGDDALFACPVDETS